MPWLYGGSSPWKTRADQKPCCLCRAFSLFQDHFLSICGNDLSLTPEVKHLFQFGFTHSCPFALSPSPSTVSPFSKIPTLSRRFPRHKDAVMQHSPSRRTRCVLLLTAHHPQVISQHQHDGCRGADGSKKTETLPDDVASAVSGGWTVPPDRGESPQRRSGR